MTGLVSPAALDDRVDALQEVLVCDRDGLVLGYPEKGEAIEPSVSRRCCPATELAMDVHHDLELGLEVARGNVEVRLARLRQTAERAGVPEDHLEVGDPSHESQSLKSISVAVGTIALYSSSSSSPARAPAPRRPWSAVGRADTRALARSCAGCR